MQSHFEDYTSLIEKAQESVEGIKDDKLREIAFGKLLDHLLSQDNSEASPKENISARKNKAAKKGKTAKKNSSGPKGWLAELIDEGFFKAPQPLTAILQELENRSHHLKQTDLTKPLQTACHAKLLRRKKISPAGGGRQVYHWSNW